MASEPTRREFLALSVLGVAATLSPRLAAFEQSPPSDDLWATADAIVRRITLPTFPPRTFEITRYGATTSADATGAFRAAIEACVKGGGGRVVVPKGRFETGAIRLRSNVNLHLDDGATIAFSRDPRAYLPTVLTRYEGVELMNYSPFIYAIDQHDIAITGAGTLDGQADESHWWNWRGAGAAAGAPMTPARTRLFEIAARGVPPAERRFGDGSFLRPNFVQTYRCRNVLIDGVTVVNSPMWELHPVLCENVVVRGVTIRSHGPNNDGCDPESCRDVLIERCSFDTGDDCIALKSGRNQDGGGCTGRLRTW
ncbi:MAG TPA: glycosyl hydrolase family 28 protein [Vicinamibacterales bacterium]|nr:glycosyl hydrolase family 28 protein [Vicinamibacterales bacterium]